MPTAPGRVQAVPSTGSPDGEKETAASVSGEHRRLAAAAARACTLVSDVQVAAPGPAWSTRPPASRARRRPLPGAAARASGTSARAAASTLGDHVLPLSLVV